MSKPVTVLIVDDDEINRYGRSRMLEHAGFSVMEATCGSCGLDLVKRVVPDVVLLDVNMPDIDGWEVCRRIKHDPSTADVLVYLVSAVFDSRKDKTLGRQCGADGYLTAPVRATQLVRTIRGGLGTRRANA